MLPSAQEAPSFSEDASSNAFHWFSTPTKPLRVSQKKTHDASGKKVASSCRHELGSRIGDMEAMVLASNIYDDRGALLAEDTSWPVVSDTAAEDMQWRSFLETAVPSSGSKAVPGRYGIGLHEELIQDANPETGFPNSSSTLAAEQTYHKLRQTFGLDEKRFGVDEKSSMMHLDELSKSDLEQLGRQHLRSSAGEFQGALKSRDELRSEIWEGINALLVDPEEAPEFPTNDVIVVPRCQRCVKQQPDFNDLPVGSEDEYAMVLAASRADVMQRQEQTTPKPRARSENSSSQHAYMRPGSAQDVLAWPAPKSDAPSRLMQDRDAYACAGPKQEQSAASTGPDDAQPGLQSSSAERCVYSLGRKLNRALAEGVEKDRKIKKLQQQQRELLVQLSKVAAALREREMQLDTSQKLGKAFGIQLELLKRQQSADSHSVADASVQTEH
eukprot:gnl/MRDRNA2_/MRDRNA2_15570_c0_seq2.p1 gnl/MRDRNA2_/MRDRNA2_15570_c0~~gnl/MRDRNA2_/MRDRNA2_15570_c0_seq2.p1  ORF type:complete len:442 (+),score=112.49 gnl/MRDRNA2_/MRDRNA2_15570_c0_seq2:107-1432(+)